MVPEESAVESASPPPKPPVRKRERVKRDVPAMQKQTTKDLIYEALNESKSRKGVSLYAIKKHIAEKYFLNIDRLNYLIKKLIKQGVIDGVIIQTKGIGATGSFKLAPVKEKKKKPATQTKTEKAVAEKSKINKTNAEKSKNKPTTEKSNKKTDKTKEKNTKTKLKKTDEKQLKIPKENTKKTKDKMADSEQPKKMRKMAKTAATPSKKKAMLMKRKSIGTIIKPPKMKPKKHD